MVFANITEFKEYSVVQKNTAWSTLTQFIKRAEKRFLIPAIGVAQLGELEAEILALPNTSDEYITLIDLAREVVANGAMWLGYPKLWITEGDMGIQQNHSREGTSVAAANTPYFEARRSYLDDLTVSMEALLQFLQENKGIFTTWAGSASFTEYNTLLIRNNRELGQFLNTADSIRAYTGLRPFLELAEQKYIETIVPVAELDNLRTKLRDNTLDANESKSLSKIRKVCAWYALYEGLPFINVKMEGTAITIAIIQDGITKHNLPSEKDKDRLSRMAYENGQLFYNQLVADYAVTDVDTPEDNSRTCNFNKPDFWV